MLLEFIRGQVSTFEILVFIISVITAITIHEFAHAVRAHQAGDPTPGQQGRLTLNPAAHYDPIGTTMILVMGLGWGRPVMTRPQYYHHPRRDGLMVSLWGPLSNVLLAVFLLLVLRFVPIPDGPWPIVLRSIVWWNLILAFFNMIPIAPLDGSKVLSSLLPVKQALQYDRFMAQYGMMVLLLLVLGGPGILGTWIGVPTHLIVHTILPGG